jgi:hypothetical protein
MLYIAHQNEIILDSISALLIERQITTWVYFGEDTSWRIFAESVIPQNNRRISIALRLDEAAYRLRQPYIDWVGGLSERNQSSLWWASEIAAKNPYHMLFTRICLLDVAYQIIGEGFDEPTLIICGTPALFYEIAAYSDSKWIQWSAFPKNSLTIIATLFRQRGLGIARSIAEILPPMSSLGRFSSSYRQFLEKHIRYRQKILEQHEIGCASPLTGNDTVLFFTWIDRRNFAPDGSYTDPNFGPLPALFKRKGFKVGFVPRILHTIPFEEAVIRLKKTNENLFFPEQFIQHNDLKKLIQDCRSFFPDLPLDSRISGIPMYSLAKEHWEQTRHLMPENLLYHPLIKRMSEGGISPSIIIHSCEGHSWENSLSLAVHAHMKQTKVVGYDNVTFSRFVLSMYPSQKEFAFKPLPDYLITNGPLFHDTLIAEGYDRRRIRCGCALRHTYLWKNDLSDKSSPSQPVKSPVKILVATAIGLGDSVELIAKAALAFGSIDRYKILIKCHPLVNISEVRKYLGHLADHQNISFSTSTIGELLPTMDILLYTYTSVCYEALMHGVYPVCVMPENFINLDKLDATPEIRMLVTNPEELFDAVEKIISLSPEEKKQWETSAQMIVRKALAPVDETCINAFFL